MASYSRREAITVKTKVAERMMSMISVQEMGAVLEAKLPQLQAALARGLDFAEVEGALPETMAQWTETLLEGLLSFVDARAWFCSPAQATWRPIGDAAEGIPRGAAGLGPRDRSWEAMLDNLTRQLEKASVSRTRWETRCR
jgi:hypothetical protein